MYALRGGLPNDPVTVKFNGPLKPAIVPSGNFRAWFPFGGPMFRLNLGPATASGDTLVMASSKGLAQPGPYAFRYIYLFVPLLDYWNRQIDDFEVPFNPL